MKVWGIDQGVTGAIAVIERSKGSWVVHAVENLPVYTDVLSSGVKRKYVDAVALADMVKVLIAKHGRPDRVQLERLIAPPGIAGTVAYSMGATHGTISSVLALSSISFHQITAGQWKRALQAPADKEAARLFASKLLQSSQFWPRKMDHNRAEAALIGAYGAVIAE